MHCMNKLSGLHKVSHHMNKELRQFGLSGTFDDISITANDHRIGNNVQMNTTQQTKFMILHTRKSSNNKPR